MFHTVKDTVDSYRDYLLVKYPSHHEKYIQRERTNAEGTRAEAIVFSILRHQSHKVTIAECISSGGIDFLCEKGDESFFVEVTSVRSDTVESRSGLRKTVEEDSSATWFRMITSKLFGTARGKAPQLSDSEHSRLLVVSTEHHAGNFLLGQTAARLLLIGDTKISAPLGGEAISTNEITELEHSIFLRPMKNGGLEPARQSISAILLASIYDESTHLVGILHPQPTKVFRIGNLPSVPFLRLKKWPLENNKLEPEWVIADAQAANIYHHRIELTDEELRSQ